ncbi:hypothetical protein Tco_0496442, partial [Tanacetum coccineum]
ASEVLWEWRGIANHGLDTSWGWDNNEVDFSISVVCWCIPCLAAGCIVSRCMLANLFMTLVEEDGWKVFMDDFSRCLWNSFHKLPLPFFRPHAFKGLESFAGENIEKEGAIESGVRAARRCHAKGERIASAGFSPFLQREKRIEVSSVSQRGGVLFACLDNSSSVTFLVFSFAVAFAVDQHTKALSLQSGLLSRCSSWQAGALVYCASRATKGQISIVNGPLRSCDYFGGERPNLVVTRSPKLYSPKEKTLNPCDGSSIRGPSNTGFVGVLLVCLVILETFANREFVYSWCLIRLVVKLISAIKARTLFISMGLPSERVKGSHYREMLENGLFDQYLPWVHPVLFVKKKDGSYALCIDYRELNAFDSFRRERRYDICLRLLFVRCACSGYYKFAFLGHISIWQTASLGIIKAESFTRFSFTLTSWMRKGEKFIVWRMERQSVLDCFELCVRGSGDSWSSMWIESNLMLTDHRRQRDDGLPDCEDSQFCLSHKRFTSQLHWESTILFLSITFFCLAYLINRPLGLCSFSVDDDGVLWFWKIGYVYTK